MKRSAGKCRGLVVWFVAACMACAMLPTVALAEDVVELSEATETIVLTAQDGASEAAPVVKTDTLTRDVTGATGAAYVEWTHTSDQTKVTYSGQSAGDHDSIQLRSKNNNSGIVTTTSGGTALSVAVDWNNNTTSEHTLNVYGKNTAYASPADLYDTEKQGTLVGTITYGTNTALTISDDYAYIGVRSNSGALYLASLTVTWANSGSTAPAYSIGVNPSEHGSVAASHTAAREGDQVTLTANPEVGYTLDTITVTDSKGNVLSVTNNTFTMPAASVTVEATFTRLPAVSYIDERGDSQDTGDQIYRIITQSDITASGGHVLESGWWVVSEVVKPSARLVINGDVHLILMDGARLEDTNGISVTKGNSLTMYGQEQGTGELIARGSVNAAGIGGDAKEDVGAITINGGTITATGGIGTGIYLDSAGGAGIGGGNGRSGGTITINGGTITATGNACAAGIGGGSYGAGGSIAITGGTVNATGGGYGDPPNTDAAGGAGIGGGTGAGGGTVTVTGGKITARGATGAAGIGPGGGFSASDDNSCGAIALSLFRSADFVQANTFVNSHGNHATVAIAYPDGTKASVKDADDETKQYEGSLTAEEIAAIAGAKLVASTAAQPTFKVASLTLSGTIGVNYFMDLNSLSENELAGCRMEFSVGDGAKRTTHVANLDAGFRDSGGEGYYGFSCPTTSIQMADTIRATFFWGDESMELPDYSVRAYVVNFDAYQASHSGAFDEKTVALVHAIADYGHFVQPYLAAENGWTIGSDYAKMDTSYTASYESELASVRSALAAYAASKSISGTPVASATMRLHLDSGTSVEALLSPAEDATFSAADVAEVAGSFSGREVSVTLRPDGRVSVRVDGVSAHLLAKPLVVSYSGQEVLRLSALSFANSTLAGSPDDVTSDAMCALYRYYEAADAYKR